MKQPSGEISKEAGSMGPVPTSLNRVLGEHQALQEMIQVMIFSIFSQDGW